MLIFLCSSRFTCWEQKNKEIQVYNFSFGGIDLEMCMELEKTIGMGGTRMMLGWFETRKDEGTYIYVLLRL
jgi:hypothetical protein